MANASIRRLASLGDVLFGARHATVIGRPILNLSFALNYAACGLDVALWHVVNLVLHLAAGLLLFGVARRSLLTAPRFAARATELAAAVALLWTVHPLQTESVAYVCQRAESLSGLLVLATLYAAIRGWTAASVAACLLAVGTKETAVAAPLLVLLHDRAFGAGTFRDALRRRPALYVELAASWIVLAALVLSSAGRAGSAGFEGGMSALDYAATQPRAIALYLGLAVWPHPLILDRGAALATTAGEIVPYAALVAALVAATLWALRARPRLGFVAAGFFVLLAPSSSVVPLVTQTVAEHRMYLPLAAVATLFVLGVDAALRDRASARRGSFVAAALVLAWTTHRRNESYRDLVTIWTETADRLPGNDRAQINAGTALMDAGDAAGGLLRFDAAVAAAPRNAVARVFRGRALLALGRADDAERAFTEMLAATPAASAIAYDERGIVRQSQGRHADAIADFDAAIVAYSAFARAFADRAASKLATGDVAGAKADVAECRRLGGEPAPDLIERLGGV